MDMDVTTMRWTRDPAPHPELVADSPVWSELLRLAWPIDNWDPRGVFGLLHSLRCQEVRLVWQEAAGGRWAFGRPVDPTTGEKLDSAEWSTIMAPAKQFRTVIGDLLRQL